MVFLSVERSIQPLCLPGTDLAGAPHHCWFLTSQKGCVGVLQGWCLIPSTSVHESGCLDDKHRLSSLCSGLRGPPLWTLVLRAKSSVQCPWRARDWVCCWLAQLASCLPSNKSYLVWAMAKVSPLRSEWLVPSPKWNIYITLSSLKEHRGRSGGRT